MSIPFLVLCLGCCFHPWILQIACFLAIFVLDEQRLFCVLEKVCGTLKRTCLLFVLVCFHTSRFVFLFVYFCDVFAGVGFFWKTLFWDSSPPWTREPAPTTSCLSVTMKWQCEARVFWEKGKKGTTCLRLDRLVTNSSQSRVSRKTNPKLFKVELFRAIRRG